MEDFKEFLIKYSGGIIGAIIALILACTSLYRLVIGIVLVVCGFVAGNYLQHNKAKVKKKIKEIIDKL